MIFQCFHPSFLSSPRALDPSKLNLHLQRWLCASLPWSSWLAPELPLKASGWIVYRGPNKIAMGPWGFTWKPTKTDQVKVDRETGESLDLNLDVFQFQAQSTDLLKFCGKSVDPCCAYIVGAWLKPRLPMTSNDPQQFASLRQKYWSTINFWVCNFDPP